MLDYSEKKGIKESERVQVGCQLSLKNVNQQRHAEVVATLNQVRVEF
jgi:hypothetical protein